jgi:hypothetical protein
MDRPNGMRIVRRRMAAKKRRASELFKKGYSYRQIQKKLGYKSVGPVQYLLK